jgi:hypothetical protein
LLESVCPPPLPLKGRDGGCNRAAPSGGKAPVSPMLPTTSITIYDVAFIFISVVVFCEVLRIVLLGLNNLQVPDEDPALDQGRPSDSLTKLDGA